MKKCLSKGKNTDETRCFPASCRLGPGEGNIDIMSSGSFDEKVQKPALLLHSCCGPCSTSVIESLTEGFTITVFYFNPCITEEDEYVRRRDEQKRFITLYNEKHPSQDPIRFMEGEYRPGTYEKLVCGLEDEAEGGRRCSLCFRQRLEKTAETAKMRGFDIFTTTLSASPHKNYDVISEIGREIALRYGLTFLDRNFRKKDGFKRSVEMAVEYDLYRQNYCGCRYSKR